MRSPSPRSVVTRSRASASAASSAQSASSRPALTIGGLLVGVLARRVEMTRHAELVAVLHSFVFWLAVLVGLASYLSPAAPPPQLDATWGRADGDLVEIGVGIAFGADVFRLRPSRGEAPWRLSGRPLPLPGRHALKPSPLRTVIGLTVPVVGAEGPAGCRSSSGSLMRACSASIASWRSRRRHARSSSRSSTATRAGRRTAAGFVLANDLLIVRRSAVGSSGAILSIIISAR